MGIPLVSIIIPNYNLKEYVTYAIDSAQAQTYSNCEIIVVDNSDVNLSFENEIFQNIKIYHMLFQKLIQE